MEMHVKLNLSPFPYFLGFCWSPEIGGLEMYTTHMVNGSLRSVLKNVRSGSPPVFWNRAGVNALIRKIASELARMHQQDVVHGNLQPAYIMIGENGEIVFDEYLMDHREADAAYGAPETFKLGITKSGDVFSLGTVFYEVFTQSQIFQGFGDGWKNAAH
jgi:serine/threonine protein kinase